MKRKNKIKSTVNNLDIRVGQKKEPYIGFIQENSIESSV